MLLRYIENCLMDKLISLSQERVLIKGTYVTKITLCSALKGGCFLALKISDFEWKGGAFLYKIREIFFSSLDTGTDVAATFRNLCRGW